MDQNYFDNITKNYKFLKLFELIFNLIFYN